MIGKLAAKVATRCRAERGDLCRHCSWPNDRPTSDFA